MAPLGTPIRVPSASWLGKLGMSCYLYNRMDGERQALQHARAVVS